MNKPARQEVTGIADAVKLLNLKWLIEFQPEYNLAAQHFIDSQITETEEGILAARGALMALSNAYIDKFELPGYFRMDVFRVQIAIKNHINYKIGKLKRQIEGIS